MSEKDFMMYRINRDIYKQLQQLKLDWDVKTINDVLAKLLEKADKK